MENFDSLIISLFDSQANIGLFKKELAGILDVPLSYISDPFIENELINGVLKQCLYVDVNGKIPKEKLEQLNFDYYNNGYLIFDIGDVVL